MSFNVCAEHNRIVLIENGGIIDDMIENSQTNNKRIAKNTLLLYVRMLFIMAIQLYTSRVVLNSLGVIDYGLYNVVGGVVTMFAFLNGAMITSTQRYITFELGKGYFQKLQKVFTTCVQIHFVISFIIIVLGETIGLWFLYEKMVIPSDRFTAAMWVYQLSIMTMCVQVMSVPYNSDIVAHEQMGVFAAISVVEVVLKLLVVYMLVIGDFDKLVMYATLIASVQVFVQFLYKGYCNRHYKETKIIKTFDHLLVKEMSKFMGWNIWGNLAATLFSTGLNLLLNTFFGPVVNAARAIAVQVETAIAQFSTNFLMAVNPQITKLYAQGNLQEMHQLLFRSSKFTFFLLYTISLPVMMETEIILTIWLKMVPDYTVVFLHLLLVIIIVDSVARPLMTAAASTGNVKIYQSLIGGILLSIVPIAYIVLKMGGSPQSVYIVHLIICILAFFTRLLVIKPMIKLSIRKYINNVIFPCMYVLVASLPLSIIVKHFTPNGFLWAIMVCLLSGFFALIASYMFGLSQSERMFVHAKCQESIKKLYER